MKLSYFQEEMMVKEDPIKTGEELEKEADQENSVTVDRPVDRTQWAFDRPVDRTQQRRNTAQIFDRPHALSKGPSTVARACRQPEAYN